MPMMTRESPPPEPRTNAPRFVRSGQMIECLKAEWLYSEKRPRDFLFNAIETLVEQEAPRMVAQLSRGAAQVASERAAERGFEFSNWEGTTRAAVNTLLSAGELRSPDGDVIAFDISSQAAIVGGLGPDFKDAAEAFLLEFLIDRLGDVTSGDHRSLAHALFRQFDVRVPLEELEDRVVILLARLSHRVVLENGIYKLRLTAAI